MVAINRRIRFDCYQFMALRAILARAPLGRTTDRCRRRLTVRFFICIYLISEACSMYHKHALGMVAGGRTFGATSSRVLLLLMCIHVARIVYQYYVLHPQNRLATHSPYRALSNVSCSNADTVVPCPYGTLEWYFMGTQRA